MKTPELRQKSPADITKQIAQWREQSAALIRSRNVAERKNVRELRLLRKDIARALTVLSEKKRQEV